MSDLRLGNCPVCWDTGVWWTPTQGFQGCVESHAVEFSAPALRLAATLWQRIEKKQAVEPQVFQLARHCVHARLESPVPSHRLEALLRATRREINAWVEELRDEWVLPIGSRRAAPSGYYWMTSAAEYIAWSRVYRAQAIRSLVIMHRLGQHNYPELAGQTAFDFTQEVEQAIAEALR
jgi:hypothetical protein